MVARNALLLDRLDLPIERTVAHKEMARLQEENARLRRQVEDLEVELATYKHDEAYHHG